jgi:hypothetical protein
MGRVADATDTKALLLLRYWASSDRLLSIRLAWELLAGRCHLNPLLAGP